ncbi:MAG: ArsA family ATPase [Dehalococcoidales bacterium]|nr:MAG: ArsA family ATPase [Dehalococcoidales bacterium]
MADKADQATKGSITMFTGKGGVGKTTCAAATALHHSSRGGRTLAISTDATPSLSHIFSITDGDKPARVTESLYVNELGIAEVKEMWDKKFGREVYEVFSSLVDIEYPEFVDFMTSVLPGLSDEFMVDYIRELACAGEYQAIVWDTAPLGQTLALLKTPALLGQHLKMAPRIYSKLKLGQRSREPVLDILRRWEELSAVNMDFLRNEVEFVVVTIPEALAVEQLEGVFGEMNAYGLPVQQLVINNVVRDDGSDFLTTRSRQQRSYLDHIHDRYSELAIIELPMFPYELKGIDRLKELEKNLCR